jgi:hypothetical protein
MFYKDEHGRSYVADSEEELPDYRDALRVEIALLVLELGKMADLLFMGRGHVNVFTF